MNCRLGEALEVRRLNPHVASVYKKLTKLLGVTMSEEQNAAIEAERETFKAMKDAQAVVQRKFKAVHDSTGSNPTEDELALAKATQADWERAKAHVEELRKRV